MVVVSLDGVTVCRLLDTNNVFVSVTVNSRDLVLAVAVAECVAVRVSVNVFVRVRLEVADSVHVPVLTRETLCCVPLISCVILRKL